MGIGLFVLVVLAIAATLMASRRRPQRAGASRPVEGFKPVRVMTSKELRLYHLMREALPDHIVLAQVAYSAFMAPRVEGRQMRNHIDRKRIDFAILTSTGDFLTGVELDGASHDNDASAANDDYKTRLLAATGLRLIRWRSERLPSKELIRESVLTREPVGDAPRRSAPSL